MKSQKKLSLQDLQQQFVANLEDQMSEPLFLNQIVSQRISAQESMAIYRNNCRFHRHKALQNIYPVCQQLVGEAYFQAMTRSYIENNPSYSVSLNNYGSHFAEYLSSSRFVLDLPYLVDVLRLEWAVHQVLTGPAIPPFDWATLAEVPSIQQPNLIFHCPENSVLYHSQFPIDKIWKTNQPGFEGDDEIDLNSGAIYLFIWRPHLALKIDRISYAQWQSLRIFASGQSLGQLSATLDEGKGSEMQSLLPLLIKVGYISKFSF